MRNLIVLMTVTWLSAAACWSGASAFAAGADHAAPQWVWRTNPAKELDVAYLRKAFDIKLSGGERIQAAVVLLAADDQMQVYLNGKQVASHEGWKPPAVADVTNLINEGANVLAAQARNFRAEGGVLMQLIVATTSGRKIRVVTDPSWRASATAGRDWATVKFDAQLWSRAVSVGKLGAQPWGKLDLTHVKRIDADAAITQATPASEIKLPDGFRAELVYSVPRDTQGSWVAMTVDGKGRLIVSDQAGGLYRVTPSQIGRGELGTRVEPIKLNIGQAQGLLWAHDSLYVVVNGTAAQGSGLYRLRDKNNDDQLDDVQLLKRFSPRSPGTEHGPHAVVLGPDDKLYIVAGNMTPPPAGLVQPTRHKNWSEDLLLPRAPASTGHATGLLAPGGWVCRTDLDGKKWELLAAGFRNSYDLAFNHDGELFAFDSDMERDYGTPWYRPTRICHVVSGAEFGWRYGTGKWPDYWPDSLPAVVNVGLSSPTGITFGYGAKFPATYQHALFACDWVYGKLYAVHLEPNGASYRGTFELFASGKPLPLTDIVIGRDGAMYFMTGGRKLQTGLYRVTYVGTQPTTAVDPPTDAAAGAARAARKQLEAWHRPLGPVEAELAVEFARDELNSRDRFRRYAARIVLEHQDRKYWQAAVLTETRPTAAIQGLLALARSGDRMLRPRLLSALNHLPLSRLTEQQLLEALRVYAVVFSRMGRPDIDLRSGAVRKLDALYPSRSQLVNRELCRVLAYLEADSVVKKTMPLLTGSAQQEDRLHYAFALRHVTHGWTPALRQTYFRWLKQADSDAQHGLYAGGVHIQAFVRRFAADAWQHLDNTERAKLQPVMAKAVQPTAGVDAKPRHFVQNWQMADFKSVVDQTKRGRNFRQGRAAFHAAQCLACHRFGNEGSIVGPDLTGVGNRFSAREVLESIIEPSKVVSDQFAPTKVITKAGDVIIGNVEREDQRVLVLRSHPLAPDTITITKADITKRELSKVSLMPQGLISVLSKEEVLDLVAYLRSNANPGDAAFR